MTWVVSGGGASGRRVAGRFEIEAAAGEGGGGTVFRARDLASGGLVALKMLRGLVGDDLSRFAREARALADLEHPNVVRYVAHGIDEAGTPFLAMEWLEGEDLRARLARLPLSPREVVALGRVVAAALAFVHARGFVHRDVKPANLFLPGGRLEAVKLLDFGLVRSQVETVSLTQAGSFLGTPGYIAPEQARGSRGVDHRADLFSLGCVLYKCLSGEAPFEGPNAIAVMTKVILEEPRPLGVLRPRTPFDLAALVHRMLHKEPEGRPDHASSVAAALAAVVFGEGDDDTDDAPPSRRVGITGREMRVAAVLLLGPAGEVSTTSDRAPVSRSSSAGSGRSPDVLARMVEMFVAEQKGQVDRLAGGTRVIRLPQAGTSTDQAAWAAQCALALRSMLPDAPMALAVGVQEVSGATPIGNAIDRATVLLGSMQAAAAEAWANDLPPPAWVAIDDETAALLDARFDVRRGEGVARLVGLQESGAGTRNVLGKATPLVGRDWELSSIGTLFRECLEGPSTCAVLVTAPAGLGKSRLAQELMSRFRDAAPEVRIWLSRCDSVHAGSPLHLLRRVVLAALHLGQADRAGDVVQQIRERVVARIAGDAGERVAELLGEIVKVPFPDEGRPGLRAARGDALILGEQMRWAWETFAAAECAAHPVVLVLEDVHWGDAPTLRFVESALRFIEGRPFFVLLLARPDVHEVFPKLDMGERFQEIRLKPLTRKASERLVEEVLGAAIGARELANVVARADGNAFYLEELMRALVERRGRGEKGESSVPETVIASVQARFAVLDEQTRRLLRAASLFGEAFWANGVIAVLGDGSPVSLGPWVDALVAQDILVRRRASRFAGESELAFRHALLREAAYAMLTEEDRALGHRLAGLWLEQQGEPDPVVLALHFERGGLQERAAVFQVRAAEQALRGLDLEAAASLASRAAAASAALRQQALGILCNVYIWRLEWEKAAVAAAELWRLAERGSSQWIVARTIQLSTAFVFAGSAGDTMEALFDLMAVEPTADSAPQHAMAIAGGVLVLTMMAQMTMAETALAKLHAISASLGDSDLVVRGWVSLGDTYVLAWKRGEPWAALRRAEAACAAFTEAGDTRNVAFAQVFRAMCLVRLGALAAAERAFGSIAASRPGELVTMMQGFFGAFLVLEQRAFDAAARFADERVESTAPADPMRPVRLAEADLLRSEIARRTGDFGEAERLLAPALDALQVLPLSWQVGSAYLARTRVALGRGAEALAGAKAAMAALEAQGGEGLQGQLVRLACAEALDAAGDREAARALLAEARARLFEQAAQIPEAAMREGFLASVEEHARIVELSAAWLEPIEP